MCSITNDALELIKYFFKKVKKFHTVESFITILVVMIMLLGWIYKFVPNEIKVFLVSSFGRRIYFEGLIFGGLLLLFVIFFVWIQNRRPYHFRKGDFGILMIYDYDENIELIIKNLREKILELITFTTNIKIKYTTCKDPILCTS